MTEENNVEHTQEPAWLSAKIDQRIAFMLDKSGGQFPEGAVIATPLAEPAEGSSKEEQERWERSCDHCGIYVPEGESFFTGQSVRILRSGHQALIFFGICKNCKEAR